MACQMISFAFRSCDTDLRRRKSCICRGSVFRACLSLFTEFFFAPEVELALKKTSSALSLVRTTCEPCWKRDATDQGCTHCSCLRMFDAYWCLRMF